MGQKLSTIKNEKENLLLIQDDLTSRRQLLEKEIQIMRDRYNKAEQLRNEKGILNTTTQKQQDYVNKELSDNNRKINLLQVTFY
jgi:chromosome segregation ATPase